MSAELDEIVTRLGALLGTADVDAADLHGRWAVYDLAMRRGVGGELLLAAASRESDAALVRSIVLRMLEATPVDEHAVWIARLPEDGRGLSLRRSGDIRTMRELSVRPRLPTREELASWSDWLQSRLAASSSHVELLRLMSERARTKKTRKLARSRMKALQSGR